MLTLDSCRRAPAVVCLIGITICDGTFAQPTTKDEGNDAKMPTRKQPSLAQRLVSSTQELILVDAERVPGINEAEQRLARSACAKAVGGSHASYVRPRLFTAKYYKFRAETISAEEQRAGNIEVLYALANVLERRVLLFPSFFTPDSILTRRAAGGAMRTNLLREFEVSHGLKRGSVNVQVLQTIIILHEQAHLNQAAMDDAPCLGLSMIKTRRIVEECFSEILETPPSRLIKTGTLREMWTRLYPGGRRKCPVCHILQQAGGVH